MSDMYTLCNFCVYICIISYNKKRAVFFKKVERAPSAVSDMLKALLRSLTLTLSSACTW